MHERLLEVLKASVKLFADETRAPVLDPGRRKTKTGQLWAYARDDRPWGGPELPGVAYVYEPDRKHERPVAHLAGFAGILQVDGYGAYKALAEGGPVTLAFCWAHVRRKFFEIRPRPRRRSRPRRLRASAPSTPSSAISGASLRRRGKPSARPEPSRSSMR